MILGGCARHHPRVELRDEHRRDPGSQPGERAAFVGTQGGPEGERSWDASCHLLAAGDLQPATSLRLPHGSWG